MKLYFTSFSLLFAFSAFAQNTPIANAVAGPSIQTTGGSNSRSDLVWHPVQEKYYSVNAGNTVYPLEAFGETGVAVGSANQNFDYRALWYNPNTTQLEGNGPEESGLASPQLNTEGVPTGSNTSIFPFVFLPNFLSCGAYDNANNQVVYYFEGAIYQYNRANNNLVNTLFLTLPAPAEEYTANEVVYSGIQGAEYGIYNYAQKELHWVDRASGEVSFITALPANAPAPTSVGLAFTNGLFWVFESGPRIWRGYQVLCGSEPLLSQVQVEICAGDSVFLEGAWQIQAGLYSDLFTETVSGCDSLVETEVVINQPEEVLISIFLCAGDSLFAEGNWQTEAGTYTSVFQNAQGCDSSIIQILNFSEPIVNSLNIAFCQGDSVEVFGEFVSQPGVLQQTFPAVNGCDSTVTVGLEWLPVFETNLETTLCEGDSVLFGDDYLSVPGQYSLNLQSVSGCDSLVNLNLSAPEFAQFEVVQDSILIYPAEFDEIYWINCLSGDTLLANQGEFEVPEAGQYRALVTLNGCEFETECVLINVGSTGETSQRVAQPVLVPNPATGNTVSLVNLPTEGGSVQIYDLTGKLISSNAFVGTSIQLDIVSLPAGVYLMQLEPHSGSAKTSKLVISK